MNEDIYKLKSALATIYMACTMSKHFRQDGLVNAEPIMKEIEKAWPTIRSDIAAKNSE